MTLIDWGMLLAFFVAIITIGTVVGKSNKSGDDYFQGGRGMPWYAISISVGMTMLSAGAFIGNPGWTYTQGLIAGMSNITIPLCIVFCTCTILPILYYTKVTTMGQFVSMRFGVRTRMTTIVLWLFNSFVLIGGFVYTPALVLQSITGLPMNLWVVVIMFVGVIYTILGGIKGAIWADTLQGVVLLVGAIIALVIAFANMGMPFGEVLSIAGESGKTVSFDFDFRWDNYNIYLCIIGSFAMWVSYFGFNQEQIQRYVTARSIRDVKKTGILSTLLMIGIYWVTYTLGIILFVFYQSNMHTLDLSNSNNIFVDFIINYMPNGVVGLMVAAVFAAAKSSLDAIMNSTAATFVKDIYEPYIAKGKKATLKQSMLFTLIIAVIDIIFVFLYLSGSSASIMQTIASMSAPMQGTLTGVLLMMLFMPFVNDKGCSLGCILGFIISLVLKSFESAWGINWLWCYVYAVLFAIILSCLFSATLFRDPEATKRTYPYTLKGATEAMRGVTDETGYEIRPLKFDRYAAAPIIIFIVLLIFLAIIQTF